VFATHALIDDILASDIPPETQAGLTVTLVRTTEVLEDTDPNNDRSACGALRGFQGQLDGRVHNGDLTQAEADDLEARAEAIRQELGCR